MERERLVCTYEPMDGGTCTVGSGKWFVSLYDLSCSRLDGWMDCVTDPSHFSQPRALCGACGGAGAPLAAPYTLHRTIHRVMDRREARGVLTDFVESSVMAHLTTVCFRTLPERAKYFYFRRYAILMVQRLLEGKADRIGF